MESNRERSILIVEDCLEDYEAMARGLRGAVLSNPLFRCADGQQALDFLFRRNKYSDPVKSPRPSLILLDLNLPDTDGREVLREIKSDDALKRIPVLVLTISDDDRDVENSYLTGANSYVKKPVDVAEFVHVIERLTGFWFEVAAFPGQA